MNKIIMVSLGIVILTISTAYASLLGKKNTGFYTDLMITFLLIACSFWFGGVL